MDVNCETVILVIFVLQKLQFQLSWRKKCESLSSVNYFFWVTFVNKTMFLSMFLYSLTSSNVNN